MSCICQYFIPSEEANITESPISDNGCTQGEVQKDNMKDKELSTSTSVVSATELATAHAEIWLLTKNLSDAHISIENLEHLIKTIMDKQNAMLRELYHLKRANNELQEECRTQRDYHTMERNAMIRELYDVKSLLNERSALLKETVNRNLELTNAVQDANEKIYTIGRKFLRLKKSRHSSSAQSSDQEQSE